MLNLIKAKFLGFDRHRFKCQIELNNEQISAYVSSSMSIKKHLRNSNLNNTDCLVYPNKSKGFTLFAIMINDQNVIVDLKIVNNLFGEYLKIDSLKYEKHFNNYICDIFDDRNKCLYEIKTIMSDSTVIQYPDVNSNRFKKQLQSLHEIDNCKKIIVFLVLNKSIKEIVFSIDLLEQLKNITILFYYCFVDMKNKVHFNKINIKNNLEG